MADTVVDLKAQDLMRHIRITVQVHGLNRTLWRVRLAVRLINLAARIGGFGACRIEDADRA